jgi:hypothetical protein
VRSLADAPVNTDCHLRHKLQDRVVGPKMAFPLPLVGVTGTLANEKLQVGGANNKL